MRSEKNFEYAQPPSPQLRLRTKTIVTAILSILVESRYNVKELARRY